MKRLIFVLPSFALLSFPLAAQEMEPCGGVTALGECQGNEAVWCNDEANDNDLQRVDCAAFEYTNAEMMMVTQDGVCEVLDDWGSWCTFDEGERCARSATASPTATFACGNGALDPTMACSISTGNCTTGFTACVPPAEGADFPATCAGDHLTFSCPSLGARHRGGLCGARRNGLQHGPLRGRGHGRYLHHRPFGMC